MMPHKTFIPSARLRCAGAALAALAAGLAPQPPLAAEPAPARLPAAATSISTPAEATPGLVSAEWLAAHLQDADLVVLDARAGLRDYLTGHIPGSQLLGVENVRSSAGGIVGEIDPPEVLAIIAGRVGLTAEGRAVVYGAESDPDATLVASALRLAGFDGVSVLDGGMKRWLAEGRPVTAERKAMDRTKPAPKPAAGALAGYDDVRRAMEKGAVVLDVRPPEQYEAGHIPGARNRFWKSDLVPDGREGAGLFRGPADLEKEYAALGVAKDKPVVVYCNTGHMASEVFYTLRYRLGLSDVRLYDGSWTDWAMRPDAPKETGAPKP